MPKCTDGTMELGRLGRRVIQANFEGGDVGSDGGLLLLRRVDPGSAANVCCAGASARA